MTITILPAADLKCGKLTLPTGPHWQHIPVGARVRPKYGRKRGAVVALVDVVGGTPRMVAVRWDNRPKWMCAEATDTLVALDEPLPLERFTVRELIALLGNARDCSAAPNLTPIREELRRREGLAR